MDNIERIEVLRGAAATVYGSGAQGGVINIITRVPQKVETTIDISRGAYGRKNYNIDTQGKIDELTYNFYYGYNLQGNVRDANGLTWPGDSHAKSMGGALSYKFNDRSKLSVTYNNIKNDYDGYDLWYNQDLRNNKYYSSDMTIRHEYTFSSHWKNSLTYRNSKVNSQLNKYNPYFDELSVWYLSNYSYRFWSEQLDYSSENHHLIMGFDYSRAENRDMSRSSSNAPVRMHNMSVYIQDDWKLLPNLTLSGGIRHDAPSTEGGSVANLSSHTSKSYQLGYDLTEKDKVYMGRSDFYILPSMDQLSNTQWGNPDLKPAYGRTSSIGYTRKFSDKNLLTINWFYTKTDRGIGINEEQQYANAYGEVARGWTTQWNTQLDQHWSANIGWSHLYQNSTYAWNTYANRGYQPKDIATFGFYYHGGKWSGGLDGFYFMRRMDRVDNSLGKNWPSDNYAVFNLSVNYQATRDFGIYAKVENLFNQLWADKSATPGVDPWAPNGGLGHYYTEPGRNLLVGVQYKF